MKIRVPEFGSAQVLVVGDVMLDRYWYGSTGRISPEAPVPVVRVDGEGNRPGGAANVALNIASLGGRVTLAGVVGRDAHAAQLSELLAQREVKTSFLEVAGVPTVTKLRVISRNQQLIRLDFEDGFPPQTVADLMAHYRPALAAADVVILSDYGKGALHDAPAFIREARAAGKPVLVDPKGRDFSHYRGATLITPNRSEFEGVVGPCPDEAALVEKGTALMRELELEALLVTRGEEGMTLLGVGEQPLHLPTHAREVFDVTGAGDTVISTLATALAAGLPLPEATVLANAAAGLVVGKLGTATVTASELRRSLFELQHQGQGVFEVEQLLQLVEDARAHGETIVMTNGCFDILHPGHVAYLRQAASLGDRLIVAVNDDDSVRRLKGPTRPVNPLAGRMEVLAALSSVDWVVPFGEDTPAQLIGQVLPDVLVKGGDYRPEEIAGGEAVRANGGSIVVLDFVEGCSTSGIIDTIRGNSEQP